MMILKTPAKINWFLSVLGKRDDGYHDIDSVAQCVDLYDTVVLENSDGISIVCNRDIPAEDNLAFRAARLIRDHAGYSGGVRITLEKQIPVAAGLGGGSSDAAAVLAGLNRLWSCGFDAGELARLAGGLGSDVTFFLNGPAARMQGRGERVSAIDGPTECVLLLVKPHIEVSTAWAYSSCSVKLTKKDVDIKLFCRALGEGDYRRLESIITNDLEDVVIRRHPVVGEIKEELRTRGALLSLMSGSGPTVFGLFRSRDEAERASRGMDRHWCRVVTTLFRQSPFL